MQGVKVNKKPKLRKPYLIVAWPGMGEVAFKSGMYLVDKLKAEEFAHIAAEEFFYLTGSEIRQGVLNLPELPQSRFFYWKNKNAKNDLVIFVSNAQPDLARAEGYSKQILEVAKTFNAETIISMAAMPQPVDHTQESRVWFTSTSREVNEELKKFNLDILSEGQISGMNGLFLAIAKREGFKGFCLLGEIPLYTIHIENPKAVLAVLRALGKILNISIDFSDLTEQIHIMETEINKLLDLLKLGPQGQGPIGEEEIEKIKKTLSQLTKLPVSVKEKIEKLFKEAVTDISKANELKGELDRWNVYKEYEDRFLDLFKKKKDRGN